MIRVLCIACALAVVVGCKPVDQSSGGGQPAGGSGVIDTMTQKNKIDAGKRAAQQVRDINAKQQEDLNEIMGQ